MEGYVAALYIRLSKEGDTVSESESITNQRSILRNFCAKHNIRVYDEYIDDGFSGGNFNRPAFNRMICDIETKQINLVITKDMSRFGRDYIQTGFYMEKYFPEKSVRYISLLDGIDTGLDLSTNEITPFRAIMNDLYAKDISKKIKSVKRDKQRKGLFIGWKPTYGYKSAQDNTNVLVVDDVAAAIVREMFVRAVAGESCRQIAVSFNERGVKTPAQYANISTGRKGSYSGLWSSERVTYMLKNRIYTGDMVQRRMEKVSYKSSKCRKLPEEEWAIVENTHEPLVDRQTFERVGRLINSRKKTRERTYDFLLKGLIHCTECGAPLGVVNRPNAKKEVVLYFVCRTYQRFTKNSACTCHCIKVDRVTNVVVDIIRAICVQYLDRETKELIGQSVFEKLINSDRAELEVKNLLQQANIITTKFDRLYNDRLNGILGESDFIRIYTQIKAQQKDIKEKLGKLTAVKKAPSPDINKLYDKFLATIEVNRELLCSLVERLEMSECRKLSICFRYSPEEVIILTG